ncbi:P27 family predicted phage terminase small subunit [Paracandidimonas soli]|uniref:P27 family predicted phage terminase small subunit n=1 Tax=Paracandidimonas soli TaxID=1917182 RepID=A0A4R3UQ39_9BURK|nr:P27 family predicted phage terminase small subunit [Paracandidimonas soli]
MPSVVHLVRGNPSKKDLGADVGGIDWSQVHDAPVCPAHLTEYAREEWDRLAPDLFMIGLINKLDQGELAVYCQAYGDWRHAREMMADLQQRHSDQMQRLQMDGRPSAGFVDVTPSGYKQISVWMQIANRAEERMRSAGSAFGLNPSSRSRITLPAGSGQGQLFPGDERDVANRYFS